MSEDAELSVQDEYELWRKNCPAMYDFVSETALTWPSLTVQWLPDPVPENSLNGIRQRLILGSHSNGEVQEYLKVGSTTLPSSLIKNSVEKEHVNSRLRITKKFKHDTDINRARYNPFNIDIVSTIGGNGDVHLYDISKEPKESSPILLKHHTENGYGLSWNYNLKNQLLTSSDDKSIALWDITQTSPVSVLNNHTDIVNEVQFHPKQANLFGSVSDDKFIKIFDSRSLKESQSIERESPINTISFSTFSSNLYAVGLQDSTIELFDLRNPGYKLHTIMGHSDSITCLEWDPHNDGILASGSQNRRVILWDISKIGEEQVQEDEDDGAPELFMMHAGHTSAITDISFNPNIPWTLATAADDNIVHLWKVNKNLTKEFDNDQDDEIDINDLE